MCQKGFEMPGISLAQAELALAEALATHTKVMQSQEYEHDGARNKRVRLEELQGAITFWDTKVNQLSRTQSAPKARRVIPLDG